MQWSYVPERLAELYQKLAVWCFDHQTETDLIVLTAVIGTCVLVIRRQRRTRRRLHRFLWGTLMKRQDREKYQKMHFEDALVDAAMEMYHSGGMTETEEKKWMIFFSERLEMFGLKPQKNVKKGIQARLKKKFGLKPIDLPKDGKVQKIDKSYDPHKPDPEGLINSRYLKEKT